MRDLRSASGARHGTPEEVNWDNRDIGDDGDRGEKLAELARTPCALEILAAIEDGGGVQEDGEDILFDQGGGHQGPRVVEDERGNEGEIGNDRGDMDAADGGVKLSPSGNVVEQGEGEQADEADAGGRRNVDSERHRWEGSSHGTRPQAMSGASKPRSPSSPKW